MRLLVVEDEKKLCDMIAKSLHQTGYEVDYSGNTVTIHTSAEKLYYEGKLDSVVMGYMT